MQTEQLLKFHDVCERIMLHCPDQHAKAYARTGRGMYDDHSISFQIPYLKSNVAHWRGKIARETKIDLLRLQRQLQ